LIDQINTELLLYCRNGGYIYIKKYKPARKKLNALARKHEKRGKIPEQHQEKRNIQVKARKKKDI